MNTLTQQQPVVPIGLGSTKTVLEIQPGNKYYDNPSTNPAKKVKKTLSELGVKEGDVLRFSADLTSNGGIKTRLLIKPDNASGWSDVVYTPWTSSGGDNSEEFSHEIEYEVPKGARELAFSIVTPDSADKAGGKWMAMGLVKWRNAKVEVLSTGSPSSDPTPDTIFGLPPIAVYAGGAVLAGGIIWAITSK